MRSFSEELSPREWANFNNEKEMFELQARHAIDIKQLDIEIAKLEAKFNSWLKLPLVLILLPVKILLVVPLCIYVATKQEVPEQLWKFF